MDLEVKKMLERISKKKKVFGDLANRNKRMRIEESIPMPSSGKISEEDLVAYSKVVVTILA